MSAVLTTEQRQYLTNPFHNALRTLQSAFGEQKGNVLRYRPEVLPFASVEKPGTVVDTAALSRDTVTAFAGILPELEAETPGIQRMAVLQMAWAPQANFKVPPAMQEESELTESDAADMVELTDVAFPGYYRPQTYKLGRYIGLRIEGQLVAMAGHRTRMPGLREISAVCTRPGFTGRGYAQHLIKRLLNDTGETPYLHVVSTNARAIAVYEALQFVHTGEVPLLQIPKSS